MVLLFTGHNMEPAQAKKIISELYQFHNSSIRELQEFLESEWYLQFVCELYEWKGEYCGEERKKLNRIKKKIYQSIWEEACEDAWGWNWHTKKAKRRIGSRAHLEKAEEICIRLGGIPKGWRTIFECSHCGSVLIRKVTAESFGGGDECPWCAYLPDIRLEKNEALSYESPISDSMWEAAKLRCSQKRTSPLEPSLSIAKQSLAVR